MDMPYAIIKISITVNLEQEAFIATYHSSSSVSWHTSLRMVQKASWKLSDGENGFVLLWMGYLKVVWHFHDHICNSLHWAVHQPIALWNLNQYCVHLLRWPVRQTWCSIIHGTLQLKHASTVKAK